MKKLRVFHKDIITKGYMFQGMNPDQRDSPVKQRGWFVYPDPGENRIPVMIVRVRDSP